MPSGVGKGVLRSCGRLNRLVGRQAIDTDDYLKTTPAPFRGPRISNRR
jgi:hypothetical protein